MPLQILVDTAEPRILNDRLSHIVNGNDWDLFLSSNVGIDVITKTVMLIPLPFTPEWQTTTTGAYRRLRQFDYNIAGSSNWGEYSPGFSGNIHVFNKGVNETVYTNESFDRNRGFFLQWFAPNWGGDAFQQMHCGWVAPGRSVSLKFWSDGNVEVWKNGQLVGNGSITKEEKRPKKTGPQGYNQASAQRSLANQWVGVCLIPCRQRELLVLPTHQEGGFNIVFEDIPTDVSDTTITEPGPFWWYVPTGQAVVQCAPLRYATSGYVYSAPIQLRYPPATIQPGTATVYYSLPGYGSALVTPTIYDAAGTAPFVANGTADRIRVRVDLAGDGNTTPFLYAVQAHFPQVVTNTYATNVDVTDHVAARSPVTLEVPESPSDVTLRVTFMSPLALESLGFSNARAIGNRPIEARFGTVAAFVGRTNSPEWTDNISDRTRDLIIECKDRWKALENYRFKEQIVLDGTDINAVLGFLATSPGYPTSALDIGPIDFTFPILGAPSEDENWLFVINPGDSAAEILQRIHDEYLKNAFMGWVPTPNGPVFRVKLPDQMPTAASGTLYQTTAAVGGTVNYVYRKFKETVLEPEANEIYVIGMDPRTELPIIAVYRDVLSMDPTLAPNLRPQNWLGEPRRFALIDRSFPDIQTVSWALGVLRDRLTPVRFMAEWECEFQFKQDGSPFWRGDVIHLENKGRYRINTISARFELENPEVVWRPTTYTGEYIGP